MLSRVLSVGLLAGLVVGLAIAVLQHFAVTPMIIEAETYEHAGEAASLQSGVIADVDGAKLILAHVTAEHAEGEEAWAPADGIERSLYTGLATVLCAVGFAMILIAGMLVAGDAITVRTAVGWGVAAFLAASLAPAFGLSPELPASAAAPLDIRQLWWIGTVVASAAALWLFLRVDGPWAKLVAILLLMAPHLIGAPQPGVFESKVPAELSAEFVARSLVVSALMWVGVGWAVGFFWERLARRTAS